MIIDSNYIWQRRIHHGTRHQKGAVPFPDSSEIGLEFNLAFERKEKLDPNLLTNGVMIDIWEFAKTLAKSEKYVMFEVLDFNFVFGLESEEQRSDFASRICTKARLMRDQLKAKSHRWKDTFVLPEHKTVKASAGSEPPGPNGPRTSRISREPPENESSGRNGAVSSDFTIMKPRGIRVKLTDDLYPFCKDAGLLLVVQPEPPEQRLSLDLLTNGAVMELLDFSKVVCGSRPRIIQEVVTHNFDITFVGPHCQVQVTKLVERKNLCQSADVREALRKEPFTIRPTNDKRKYQKRRLAEVERLTEDIKRVVRPRQAESEGTAAWQDINMSYMCPVDFEMEVQSGLEPRPENGSSGAAAGVKSEDSLDIKREEEELFISPGYAETHTPRVKTELLSNVFSEDSTETATVKTMKQKLWIRRSSRSKEILSSCRVNDIFARCRKIGLDFNVGSGGAQKLDLRLLTNGVLCEVHKFASAMRKTIRKFLFAVLDSNFTLVIQDEVHRRNFLFYIITKVKVFQSQAGKHSEEFLSSSFQLPEVYNMVDVTSEFLPENSLMSEPQEATVGYRTHPEPHPFCKKLGIDLWSPDERLLSEKLDLSVLTNGAVLEIVGFVRDLCGTVGEMVNDVLEHNFDVDLQNESSTAARVIQRWHTTHKALTKKPGTSAMMNKWLSTVVIPDNPSNKTCLTPQALPADAPEVEDERASKPISGTKAACGDVEQSKVSEACGFHICKEIGLVLDIRSPSEAKAKLDLRVLTRGALFEVHRYVELNCNRYVPALYEILDYNFDLSSQRHRKVEFAWSVASQVIAMVGKRRRSVSREGEYLNKVFELPFEVSGSAELVCKEEPEDGHEQPDADGDDVTFVRELQPVDIEVEVE